jgi:hypothetical protein
MQQLFCRKGKKMTTEQAIKYFGSRKEMALALGIGLHGTYKWGDNPPPLRQFQMQKISNGKLKSNA